MKDTLLDGRRDGRGVALPLGVLVLSGVVGNLVGRGLGMMVTGGVLHDLLISGFRFGIDPPWTLNLAVFSVSVGFSLNLTFLGALAMVLFLLLYKKA
jgi:hypothetical protein